MNPPAQAHRYRHVLAPLVTVLVLALCALALALPYLFKYQGYQQDMQKQAPRIQRLLGLADAGPALAEREQAYQAALDALAFPPDKEGEALHNELSTRLRQAVNGSGLTVTSLSPLPNKPQEGVERYPVSLSVSGNLAQLQNFLATLHQPPRLLVDSMTIRQGRPTPDGAQIVNVEITIVALRRSQV